MFGALIAVVCAVAGPAASSPPPSPAYVHYYFDTPRELTLDTTRLAVFGDGLGAVSAADLGLPLARVEPSGLAGMHFVSLPASRRSRAGVERALDEAGAARGPSATFVSPVFIGEDGGPVVPTPTMLVRFAPDADPAARDALLAEMGQVLESDWAGMPGAYRVASALRDGRAVLDQTARAARRADVAFAEPDMAFTGRGSLIPSDPSFLQAWGLHNVGQNVGGIGTIDIDMNAPAAWDLETGDPDVLVLVIDVGVAGHPEIHRYEGADFTSDPASGGLPFNTCDNHGTPVAGCISSKMNNGLGACGIAPSCRVVPARAMSSYGTCDNTWFSNSSWTVNALAYGQTLGCRVTNNSNRYGFTSAAITDMYAQTKAAGMVHFASAGNDAQMTVDYPAWLPSVNAITACSNRGQIVSFSNRGPEVFMTGPGLRVFTTDRPGAPGYEPTDFGSFDGTSFASPLVAGVAALMISANPALTPPHVESILASTAKNLGTPGWDTNFGWGLPNAHAAVQAALAYSPCAGDCDGNGSLNVDDVQCFTDAFLSDAPLADCDASGSINVDDVECFVDAFLAGCP